MTDCTLNVEGPPVCVPLRSGWLSPCPRQGIRAGSPQLTWLQTLDEAAYAARNTDEASRLLNRQCSHLQCMDSVRLFSSARRYRRMQEGSGEASHARTVRPAQLFPDAKRESKRDLELVPITAVRHLAPNTGCSKHPTAEQGAAATAASTT